jgi:23S rRNA G2069 N7-methylase RlmK/C1962 C5-methylase RlmI
MAGLLTIPVMAWAEGFDPPSMSCMKKVKAWEGSALALVVVVAAELGVVATGATLVTGGCSSRVRAEVVDKMVRVRNKREAMALVVLERVSI